MSKNAENEGFGANLKAAREHRRLNAAQLADIIGVDNTTISKWENNSCHPRPATLGKLHEYFKVDTFDIPQKDFRNRYGFAGVYDGMNTIKLYSDDYGPKILELASKASEFVNISALCLSHSRSNTFRPIELINTEFCKKLEEGSIIIKRVQIFFVKKQLINAMNDECLYFWRHYYCKYFPTPSISMPVINVRSYDDRAFVIGGMYNEPADRPVERDLIFGDKQPIRDFLMEYWRLLWTRALPFPKPGSWDGIEEICRAVGMVGSELQWILQELRDKYPGIA